MLSGIDHDVKQLHELAVELSLPRVGRSHSVAAGPNEVITMSCTYEHTSRIGAERMHWKTTS